MAHGTSTASGSSSYAPLQAQSKREAIRCSHCGLVQFTTEAMLCRRCRTPFPDVNAAESAGISFSHRFGETVYYFRKEQSLSRAALAVKLKRSVGYVSRVEEGKHQPSVYDLHHFAEALGCDCYWFVMVMEHGAFLYDLSRFLPFVLKRDRDRILQFAEAVASEA